MSRYATVSLTSDLEWSDAVKFDGYLVFQIVLPSVAQSFGVGGQLISPSPSLAASHPTHYVPLWHVIPVVGGKVSSASRIWRNSSYNPRGTKYKLFIFDSHFTLLTVGGAPSGLFAVEADLALTLSPVSIVYTDGQAAATQIGFDSLAIYTSGNTGGNTLTQRVINLTADTLISQVVESSGTILVLEIVQDATGFWAVTWSGDFDIQGTHPFNTSPNGRTTLIFVSNGTDWLFYAGDAGGA